MTSPFRVHIGNSIEQLIGDLGHFPPVGNLDFPELGMGKIFHHQV